MRLLKKSTVDVILGTENQDIAAIDNRDQFDVQRASPKHVSFGYGIQLCLGLSLARLEAKVAIVALLGRFPDLPLADQEVDWQPGGLVRGMNHLTLNIS